MQRPQRFIGSVAALFLFAVPASSTVLQYDLANFASTSERKETHHLSDGSQTVATEIISDSERLARQVGIFAYQLKLDDTLLPFDLAGATLTLRQSRRSSLVSALGERIEWVFDPLAGAPALPAPAGLVSFKNYSATQTSVFFFDSQRHISDFQIYGDFDGEDITVNHTTAARSLFGGFLPPEQRRIDIVFSGLDLRFMRSPAGFVANPYSVASVPLPPALSMLLIGLATLMLIGAQAIPPSTRREASIA